MDTSGAARLAAILKAPPDHPLVGLAQTPRTFRMGVVTGASPLVVEFNNDPLAVVSDLPRLRSYSPIVGDLVVAAVFEGGGMVVLGAVG